MCGGKFVYVKPDILWPCIFDQVFIWTGLVNSKRLHGIREERTFDLIPTHVYSHWRLMG